MISYSVISWMGVTIKGSFKLLNLRILRGRVKHAELEKN